MWTKYVIMSPYSSLVSKTQFDPENVLLEYYVQYCSADCMSIE